MQTVLLRALRQATTIATKALYAKEKKQQVTRLYLGQCCTSSRD